GLGNRAERRSHLFELRVAHVAGHDPGAAPGGLERMAPEAAAEIEQPIARLHAELGVVDGEHQRMRPCPARARISRSARYCATVAFAVCAQLHRLITRSRPAAPTLARSAASSRPRRMVAASASASAGGHDSTVSPSAPVTSG